jgi:hypothetical protein
VAVHAERFDLVNDPLIIILTNLGAIFSIGNWRRRKLLCLLADRVKHFGHVGFCFSRAILIW